MIKGTKVGQAYVALAVDGSGAEKDIIDSFQGPDYHKLGSKIGDDIARGIEQSMTGKGGLKKQLSQVFDSKLINEAFDTRDALNAGVENVVADMTKKHTKARGALTTLGKRMAKDLGVAFEGEAKAQIEGSILSLVEAAGKKAKGGAVDLSGLITTPETKGGTELVTPGPQYAQLLKANQKFLDDKVAATLRAEAELKKLAEKELADSIKASKQRADTSKKTTDSILKDLKAQEKGFSDLFASIADDDSFEKFAKETNDLLKDLRINPRVDPAAVAKMKRDLQKDLETRAAIRLKLRGDLPLREQARLRAELESIDATIKVRVNEKTLNESLARATNMVSRNTKGNGDVIGKMFGAGSRNNALNLIGRSIGGVINLAEKASAGINTMLSSVIGGTGGVAKFAATFVSAGVSIGMVTLALSALVTVASAALAALSALAATVASGLAGAAIVAGAGFAGLAVAAGLATAAFMSMNKEQRKLRSEAFKPLAAEMRGIGQLMAGPMTKSFGTWAKNLRASLVQLVPLAKVMGGAFAEAGNTITKSLSGPGFKLLSTAMTKDLPGITTAMSAALGNFLNGMSGIFAAATPQLRRFADYLAKVTGTFSEWATSLEGQNAISDFTDRAVASLQELWGFVSELGGLFSDVLFSSSGQDAGNGLFAGLTKSIADFRASISDDDLAQWFEQGRTFAEAFGTAIAGLAGALTSMQSSGSLELIVELLRAFGEITAGMAPVLGALASTVGGLASAFAALPGPLQALLVGLPLLSSLGGGASTMLGSLSASLSSIGGTAAGAAGGVSAAGGAATGAAGGFAAAARNAGGMALALGGLSFAAQDGASGLQVLGGGLAAIAGGLMVGGPIGGAVAGFTVALTTLANGMDGTADAAKRMEASLSGLDFSDTASTFANSEKALNDLNIALKDGEIGVDDYIAGMRAVDAGFKGANASLRKLGAQVGLNTKGWENLGSVQFDAKLKLIKTTEALLAQGYALDDSGNKTIGFGNTIRDLSGVFGLTQGAVNGLTSAYQYNATAAQQAAYQAVLAASTVMQALSALGAASAAFGAIKVGITAGTAIKLGGVPKLPTAPAYTGGGGGGTPNPMPNPMPNYSAKTPKAAKKYKNPYIDFANSLIKEGPALASMIENAFKSTQKLFVKALKDAAKAMDLDAAWGILAASIDDIRTKGVDLVKSARDALNDAARDLAGATSKKEAEAALRRVRKAQKNLAEAQKEQARLDARADQLAAQQKVRNKVVAALVADRALPDGIKTQNVTLSELASAREQVAEKLKKAEDKLEAAIQIRDSFRTAITDSITAFGALTTATAKSLDGVEQALTANDIVGNLQDRLAKIQKFQENLRLLVGMGLSDAAYKQLLDAGVEGGSAYAQALVEGGAGFVSTTNNLLSQIGAEAGTLGKESSDRLYQQGVDDMQALVSGLASQMGALDQWALTLAENLEQQMMFAGQQGVNGLLNGVSAQTDNVSKAGRAIGNAFLGGFRFALQIKSPSRVMDAEQDYVGDGIVNGLKRQHQKVGSASATLAAKVAVSPEVARWQAQQGVAGSVSGNGYGGGLTFAEGAISVTSNSANPETVALEVLNEITGRL